MEAVATNSDRLRATLSLAADTWRAEQGCQPRNATNESAWSVQVVEPVLAALGWPRLRQGDAGGTGAYFEWPKKNVVDVALLVGGRPLAYWELKKQRRDCNPAYLQARLGLDPALPGAAYAVAAWHEQPGFRLHRVLPGRVLDDGEELTLADAAADPTPLARLAATVLSDGAADIDAWLASPAADAGPARPRFRPRDVQRRFFELLGERLGLPGPLVPRHRCTVHHPPTPTYAFAELPGVLPGGWGLVFGIDPTVNDLQCSFFRGGNVEVENVGRHTFDGVPLDDEVLRAFLDERVLPHVERWRREAVGGGNRA